ncbi:FecR family protein [Emticicia sp. 21SJ11W-3]|uniref:FecR family protein n=1 Tax=Emticicia sp. 21SJ11W-3 TaxID=2916755 RepID=UPI0020A1A371|nr:FecR domain-containing protein [Emticicia sp. 21SJ11W-3]UTA66258.1 FecR domain-containing protein [Emticicia sp. 21SJ11W-3]
MNTNRSDNHEDLLGKYLAQETDAHEDALIEKWLEENDAHQKELNDYTFIWDKADLLKEQNTQPVDTDAAWLKVKARMDTTPKAKVIDFKPAPKPKRFFSLGIAASILVVLTAGLLAYFFSNPQPEMLALTTTGNTLQQTLPDGSVVFLNNNTSIVYPENFEGDTREITLKGEAFFDIKRNESKPFVIHANGSDIRVLGTSFNVKAYNKNVEVSVETGKVEFKNKKKAALLVAGEKATFENDTIKKLSADKNAFAYKTKVFVFENQSLEEIAKALADGYHTNIVLTNNRIKTCRLTTRFNNESLPNALNIIAETLNLTVSAKEGAYVLDGQGCAE